MTDDEKRILTPEESDALLDASVTPEPVHESRGVREIEPTQWEQVRPSRNPVFEAANQDIAAALEQIWIEQYRKPVVVSPEPVQTPLWREHVEAIDASARVSLIEIRPDGKRGLIVLQTNTISAMVDLYFGGSGSSTRNQSLGPLTEMEQRRMTRFIDSFVPAIRKAWARHGQLELSRSAEGYEPELSPPFEASARIVVVPFAFALGEIDHRIDVIWPGPVIERLRTRARPALPGAQQRTGPNWSARLREDVKDARVELRAVLDGSTIRLADIARAQPGDVIPTEALTRVMVYAGSKPVFEGTLGARRGLNAVKISQPVNKRILGDN